MLSNEDLIIRCQSGNKKAIEELIRQNCKLVVGIAYNIVGDLDAACEISQEALLKVINHIHEISSPAKFRSWLFAVTRSTCIDWIRKQRQKPQSLDYIISNKGDIPQTKSLDTYNFEQEEIFEKIVRTINSLPKIYRDVVLLRQLRDMNYKEIAEQLGISEATVDSRLYRARLILKEKLKTLLEGV